MINDPIPAKYIISYVRERKREIYRRGEKERERYVERRQGKKMKKSGVRR